MGAGRFAADIHRRMEKHTHAYKSHAYVLFSRCSHVPSVQQLIQHASFLKTSKSEREDLRSSQSQKKPNRLACLTSRNSLNKQTPL